MIFTSQSLLTSIDLDFQQKAESELDDAMNSILNDVLTSSPVEPDSLVETLLSSPKAPAPLTDSPASQVSQSTLDSHESHETMESKPPSRSSSQSSSSDPVKSLVETLLPSGANNRKSMEFDNASALRSSSLTPGPETVESLVETLLASQSSVQVSPSHTPEPFLNLPIDTSPKRKKSKSPHDWTCDQCDKPFSSRRNLHRHNLIHANIKAFRCACGARFNRLDYLRKHGRIHVREKEQILAMRP